MSALANVGWEPCFVEARHDRALERYARRRFGLPNGAVRYFAAVPWVARVSVDMHPEFGLLMHLEQRTADLIGIVVSQENACRFCFARSELDDTFQLEAMPAERVKGIAEPVLTYAVREHVAAAA